GGRRLARGGCLSECRIAVAHAPRNSGWSMAADLVKKRKSLVKALSTIDTATQQIRPARAPMPRTLVGPKIRDRRKALGLTQAGLAHSIGISASYLNLIESSRRPIAGALLKRVA